MIPAADLALIPGSTGRTGRINATHRKHPDAIVLSVKSARTSDPELPGSVGYSFDVDVGEFDLGHRLIARSITLWNDRLFSEYAFVPGITPEEWEDRGLS